MVWGLLSSWVCHLGVSSWVVHKKNINPLHQTQGGKGNNYIHKNLNPLAFSTMGRARIRKKKYPLTHAKCGRTIILIKMKKPSPRKMRGRGCGPTIVAMVVSSWCIDVHVSSWARWSYSCCPWMPSFSACLSSHHGCACHPGAG